jgi:hypothetical protein
LLTASYFLSTGVATGEGEGETRKGTIRRLVNHLETWKTYDETNFAKSADVTHFIDFGEESRDNIDVLRQNELLRCVMLAARVLAFSPNLLPVKIISSHHGHPVFLNRYTTLSGKFTTAAADSAAEEAVIHTLTHGMAKCTTTVAFHEEFEDT